MKRKILLSLCLLYTLPHLNADTFEEYLKEQNQSYDSYKENSEKAFTAYQKAYEEGLNEYKNEIAKIWPQPEVSTRYKWVQYNKDYDTKKSVDFENENIQLEVIANNEEEARKKILASFDDLLKEDVKKAYENDQLENKINDKLKRKEPKSISDEKIISDILTQKKKEDFIEILKTKPLEKVVYNNKIIYKANLQLPPDSMIKKAALYKNDVEDYSNKNELPKELIFAIMHSESSFNPMARSAIPAYGLMQIVPKSAGVDTYNFLYGEKKLLSSSYLYNPNNNIKIGSTYLHILYYKYLKEIQDPQSRLYCTIAGYNTGAGNVAKTFVGSYNISAAANVINTMDSQEVYKKLMRNLPYNETRKYLQKVNDRRFVYNKLLTEKKL
ncbi:MAG: transglycosylase SLT domain-containing protein [Candidatus Marinarcus sp.]|uniref:transglycosylase SLT domain-containing protein n=1 Tax=Candidatus Marinarcus sp. TaxID=3100987 RepID=UPI003B001573